MFLFNNCTVPLVLILFGGSKVDSVFHTSEVDQMSIRNFCGLSRGLSVALRELNPIQKMYSKKSAQWIN